MAAQRAHAALSSAGVFNGYSELFSPDLPAPEPEAELQGPAALEAAGLRLHCDVVTAAEEAALLAEIDAAPWDCSIHRRVQHFGERFDYITKTVGATRPPPLPKAAKEAAGRRIGRSRLSRHRPLPGGSRRLQQSGTARATVSVRWAVAHRPPPLLPRRSTLVGRAARQAARPP